jgi:UDP-glucose:glycoprotein glucosyltransferase
MTDEGEYTLALKAAGNFCGAATMSSLKFSLGIRNYSPAAELHRQLFREEVGEKDIDRLVGCAGVVAVGGELVCVTAENAKAQIKEAFATTSMQRAEEFDHVWPGASGTSAVILYAQLSSLSFANLHTAAVENAFETGLAYVLRPLVPLSSDSFNLQGFGVELAIKSMEYKVIDDTKIEIGADDQAPSVSELLGEEAAEQDVSGFYFDKLLSRRPDLGTDLNTFRESLLAASVEDSKSIKAWDMKNLGTQAAQVILRSKDPLLSLRDIAQNFPMYATSLTRLRVNTTVEQVLKKRGDRFDPNRNLLFINGQQLDLAKLDIFEMHALLKRDAAKNDLLAELHLPTEARVAFRSLRIAEETGGKRVDMGLRKKAEKAVPVIWLNNIEKDAAYKQWGKSVSQLLQPSWGGQLKYIRKNLFNVVLTFDPATAAGLEVFDKIQFFAENQAPLRCALAFVIPSTTVSLLP